MQLTKKARATQAFEEVWTSLFTTPVHLDSALSKQPVTVKSILARTIPLILARPVSLAQVMGVGVGPREPWDLTPEQKARWKAAPVLFERLYEMMTGAFPELGPVAEEDFPPWMFEAWVRHWGREQALALAQTLATEAPLSLRCNRQVTPAKLIQEFKSGGDLPVKIEPSRLSPSGVVLKGYVPVMKTERYEEGGYEIQDEGSQYMSYFSLWPEHYASLLGEHPGAVAPGVVPAALPDRAPAWTVIDACAGAGGKTLAMADALMGRGRVYAYDTAAKKLEALRRRARRAGVNNTQAVAVERDGEVAVVKRFAKTADVVLVDAPCTGWGVLRRNPDIKWRQETETLEEMPRIQSRVLSLYSGLVKSGGRLVFGVCTFRPEETRDIVSAFVEANPDFKAEQGGYLGPGPCDGFYMHSFKRS